MQQRQRRVFGTFICVLGIVLGVAWWYWPRPQLNVVLITLDTTRSDRIGCYDYPAAQTPTLDALAARGVLFKRAYTPVPLTLPSHTSMLTGLYPPEHGLRVNGIGRLAGDIATLPEILKRHRYETGAFLSAFVLSSKFGLDRGFQTYDDDLSRTAQADTFVHRRRDGQSAMDAALAWLQQRCSRPFFCWIHLFDAHGPYDAREPLFGKRFSDNPYDAGIAAEDLQIKRLLDFLQSNGISERTLVIVVGDHGEGLMQHGEQEHGMLLNDATIHVPLVVAGPSLIKPGHHVSEAVSLVDLMPTILDCLSLRPPGPVSGRSLRPALAGQKITARPCYAETDAPFAHHWSPLRAVITESHKYIQSTRPELYDLTNDPGETRNLLSVEGTNRELGEDLAATLDVMIGGFVARSAGNVHLTPNEQQILSSLGYVGGKRIPNEANSHEPLPDIKDMLAAYNMLNEAKELFAARQTAAVIHKLEAVLDLAPQYDEAHILLGDVLMNERKFAQATEEYQHVLAKNPDQPMALAHLAGCLAAQGQFHESVANYRRALEIDSESATWHLHFAKVLLRLGKPRESMAEFQEALRCDPGYVKAHLEFGAILMESGQPDSAIKHFEIALKLHPGLAAAHINLGAALSRAKRDSEALVHTQRAVELEPENFEARFNFGTMLLMEHRISESVLQLEEAARLRPDDPRPRQHLERANAALRIQ